MGYTIIGNNDQYNIYSSVSDSPVFESALTKDQLKEYIKEETGKKGLKELKERLVRVDSKGTSSLLSSTLEEDICVFLANKKITLDEFKETYLSFKESSNEVISTSDFWYDLFEGGYINPDNLLDDKEDIYKINKAIETLRSFKTVVLENGVVEEI